MVKNASHIPSFIVIVSCYKPSGSILNFIELILKAFIRGVPKRTGIFQDLAHQSLMCFLFYRLGISVYISSQEAKGPISLSANITDMCVPSQIICDSTWYFLCFREPFPPDYMKHRHFWSISLLFFIILHLTGWIISESMSVEISVLYKENNKGPRTVPWGTPDKTGAQSDFAPFKTTQKRIYPFQCLSNCYSQQFALKELVRWDDKINTFSKSYKNISTCPPLSRILAQFRGEDCARLRVSSRRFFLFSPRGFQGNGDNLRRHFRNVDRKPLMNCNYNLRM